MEPYLATYDLPFEPFQELLRTSNSLLAGSAALALYLRQEGVDPGFEPNDIDIWVENTIELVSMNGSYRQPSNLDRFSNFLVKHGYHILCHYKPEETDYNNVHQIRHVLSFKNNNGKLIQVILVACYDLKVYLSKQFDLSVCMTWWNAATDVFANVWPHQTVKKEMYYFPSEKQTERELERIKKYETRGFRLLESPCPYLTRADKLEFADALKRQTAFDTVSLEEVDIYEFLKASSWHVILHIGEQFQAFHRKVLINYLESHRNNNNPSHYLYDTPYKQTISHDAYSRLKMSDYTMVELRPNETFLVGNQSKTLFECRFYTTRQWVLSEHPGLVCTPPSKVEFEAHEPIWQEPDYYPVSWVDA